MTPSCADAREAGYAWKGPADRALRAGLRRPQILWSPALPFPRGGTPRRTPERHRHSSDGVPARVDGPVAITGTTHHLEW